MYTSVPSYEVDLDLPEEARWREVIRKERRVVRRVARQALAEVEAIKGVLGPVGWLFGKLYGAFGGLYGGEVEAWAKAMRVSKGTATLLNCMYELSQATGVLGATSRRLFGCTAGVRHVKGVGMVHLRNMDWDLSEVGNGTRLFWFKKGDHRFVSVGITGFVGVLSGMVPGAYSATINQAPAVRRPTFDFGPAFLLRDVLETCPTYDEAVYALEHTDISTSVFFTVCGSKRGEACVIERTQDDAAVRKIRGGVLVQTNHHIARKFVGNNEVMTEAETDEETGEEYMSPMEDSTERAEAMERALSKLKSAGSLEDAARVLDIEPIRNEQSYQQMAFCPRTGEVAAWRWRS